MDCKQKYPYVGILDSHIMGIESIVIVIREISDSESLTYKLSLANLSRPFLRDDIKVRISVYNKIVNDYIEVTVKPSDITKLYP